MVDAQTISIIFAGVSIGVAAIYYTLTLRNTQRAQQLQLETRQAQLFMNLYEAWRSPDFRKRSNWVNLILEYEDKEDFWSRYGPEIDPDAFATWASIAAYYAGIGVLVKRELIDIELVFDLLHHSIKITWETMSPEILESRLTGNPQLWSDFEFLYNEIVKMEKLTE